MSFNIYPDQVQAILTYIRALDAADEEISQKIKADAPYLKAIQITDGDDSDLGTLVDEVGGAWSWKAPE